jgi:arylsulfatase A-like enzyme
MTRRNLLTQGLALAGARGLAQTAAQPNVLFIAVDDLDCRIGCYGDRIAKTPSIDRLAARGVRFDRAYCQYPLCNPTRSSVLSGRYPTSTGVLDNNTWLVLNQGQQPIPRYFEQHGYNVASFGKIWHGPNRGFQNGEPLPETPRGWFTPQDRARQQAAQPDYWNSVHSPYRNMKPPDPSAYAWANEIGPLPAGEAGDDARIADNSIKFLGEAAKSARPFFLATGFLKPHVPLRAPKEFFDLYDPDLMTLPPDFDTEPRHVRGMPADEFRQNMDLFAGRSFSTWEARQAMRAYYACTSYMDAQAGRLLDKLKETGADKNTVIVFWGDHGWHLSEKGMWAKGTLFEVSARGPLIISDPRERTAGQASSRVVQFLDMFPTLADACGLPVPDHLQGASLRPLLADPSRAWRRPAYTVQARNWFIGRSVRDDRWRFTEWDEGRRGQALFDHANDPHETRNLALDKQYEDVVNRMLPLLREGPVAPGKNTA